MFLRAPYRRMSVQAESLDRRPRGKHHGPVSGIGRVCCYLLLLAFPLVNRNFVLQPMSAQATALVPGGENIGLAGKFWSWEQSTRYRCGQSQEDDQ